MEGGKWNNKKVLEYLKEGKKAQLNNKQEANVKQIVKK